MMLCYCANLKAIRYESTSLNRIVADKSYRVIVALHSKMSLATPERKLTGFLRFLRVFSQISQQQ